MANPYAPAPSSSDRRSCVCCGAPFGIDWDNCDCEAEERTVDAKMAAEHGLELGEKVEWCPDHDRPIDQGE